eukprot:7419436-Ditylum_brightwellii.AAC.1
MPNKKKTSGRGATYITTEKHLLVSNMGVALPVFESGWDRVHGKKIKLYGAKNRTVESLRCCFTNMHRIKAPSGDPAIAQEISEAKMAWLQIWAELECSTGSSEESVLESEEEEDKKEDMLQELLAPHIMQTIPSFLAKKK